jgi:hypothetical protein
VRPRTSIGAPSRRGWARPAPWRPS